MLVNWTPAKNRRRCELIDREIAGKITYGEFRELRHLQEEMIQHRKSVAPLPLGELRELQKRVAEVEGE
jgi:hypothetical protein